MATISVSLPSDGTTADVADYNTPITTVVNAINGGLDNDNIKSAAAIDGSKLADKSVTLAKINGGSTAGIPKTDSSGNVTVTAASWVTPTLSTGWTQFDTGTIPTTTVGQFRFPRYIQDATNEVHLQGLVKNNSGGNNTTSVNKNIFTLPSGLRPGHTIQFAVDINGAFGEITIESTGAVNIATTAANNGFVSLSNISFMPEQ